MNSTVWHARSVADVCRLLGAEPDVGLSPEEAARRLVAHGPIALVRARRRGPVRMLLAQFSVLTPEMR